MVEIMRSKWCEDLEDLLQCPICMNRPKGNIYQCVQGHHICDICKSRMPYLSLCPTCAGNWSASRNRLAENLCAKLDEIKESLIDPDSEINKILMLDRVSVATQTDPIEDAGAAALPAKKAEDEHAGAYSCRIGSCGVTLFFTPMMKHIKTDHRTQFVEIPLGENPVFNYTWPINYSEQMIFDRAFHIPSMGTFFVKLSSDVFGNFTGFILMLHNGFISRKFTYQLEITCCDEHNGPMYTGEVNSCRSPATVMKDKILYASRTEMQRLVNHEKQLKCTVLLGKKPESAETEQSSGTNQQKRNQRYPQRGRGGRGGGRNQGNQGNQGNSGNPGNSNYQNNRQNRPQAAPRNGQSPPRPLFPPGGHSRSRQPSRATSVASLPALYPDLHDIL